MDLTELIARFDRATLPRTAPQRAEGIQPDGAAFADRLSKPASAFPAVSNRSATNDRTADSNRTAGQDQRSHAPADAAQRSDSSSKAKGSAEVSNADQSPRPIPAKSDRKADRAAVQNANDSKAQGVDLDRTTATDQAAGNGATDSLTDNASTPDSPSVCIGCSDSISQPSLLIEVLSAVLGVNSGSDNRTNGHTADSPAAVAANLVDALTAQSSVTVASPAVGVTLGTAVQIENDQLANDKADSNDKNSADSSTKIDPTSLLFVAPQVAPPIVQQQTLNVVNEPAPAAKEVPSPTAVGGQIVPTANQALPQELTNETLPPANGPDSKPAPVSTASSDTKTLLNQPTPTGLSGADSGQSSSNAANNRSGDSAGRQPGNSAPANNSLAQASPRSSAAAAPTAGQEVPAPATAPADSANSTVLDRDRRPAEKADASLRSSSSVPQSEIGRPVFEHRDALGTLTNTNNISAAWPVNQQRLVDQIARLAHSSAAASAQSASAAGEISVRLTPPELGPVLIEVSSKPEGVHARIETTTPAAEKTIVDHLPQLRESLQQAGLTLDRLEVHHSREGSSMERNTRDQGASFTDSQQQRQSPSQQREQPPREQIREEGSSQIPRTRSQRKLDAINVRI